MFIFSKLIINKILSFQTSELSNKKIQKKKIHLCVMFQLFSSDRLNTKNAKLTKFVESVP